MSILTDHDPGETQEWVDACGRILVTLLHEMIRRNAKKGLASLCIGGGMGVALAIES